MIDAYIASKLLDCTHDDGKSEKIKQTFPDFSVVERLSYKNEAIEVYVAINPVDKLMVVLFPLPTISLLQQLIFTTQSRTEFVGSVVNQSILNFIHPAFDDLKILVTLRRGHQLTYIGEGMGGAFAELLALYMPPSQLFTFGQYQAVYQYRKRGHDFRCERWFATSHHKLPTFNPIPEFQFGDVFLTAADQTVSVLPHDANQAAQATNKAVYRDYFSVLGPPPRRSGYYHLMIEHWSLWRAHHPEYKQSIH